MLPTLINRPLFPAIARSAKESKEKMGFICQCILKFQVIISLPMTVFFIVIAEKLISFLLGEQFIGSALALQILAPIITLIFINCWFGCMLIALHRQRFYTYGMLGSLVINLILDFILIPYLGYKGACIANLVSESFLSIAVYYFVRQVQPLLVFRVAIRPVLSALGVGVFIYLFRQVNLFILLPSSLLLYVMLLILSRTFSRHEIDILKRALPMRRPNTGRMTDFLPKTPPSSSTE